VVGLEKLPEAAKKLCNSSNSQGLLPNASIDPKAHMAVLADNKQITVWKLGQGAISSYLYNFDIPFTCSTPPHVRLFALKGASRVEGYTLFACSTDGNLVLWYSLSYNQGNHTQHQIPLKLGETITSLSEFSDGKFVAGTSLGEVFVIDVQLEGSISITSLRKRNSMLQRVGSWLSGANALPLRTLLNANSSAHIRGKHEEIVQIHIDTRPNSFQQNEIVVLSGQSIQRYQIEMSNRSKIVSSVQIYDKILVQLKAKTSIDITDIGILDFAIERSGKLVILVAFKERDIHGYALVITSNTASQLEPDGDILMDDIDGAQLIEDIIRLDYADNGLDSTRPSLLVPNGGPIAVMHIGSNILYRHLHATLKVEERIELKNAKENALLSWKNAKENAWSRDDEPTARIQLLTAQAGLLELTVDINRLSELLTPDSPMGESDSYNVLTRVLTKSHLEQAVFFETKPNNPLTFPLYPNTISYMPAVNQSAVELSQEIISGESAFLVPRLDLQEHLATRVAVLKTLLECIYKGGLNTKTGVNIPPELCTNLEAMSAASALWTHIIDSQNDSSKASFRITSAAIPTHINNDHNATNDTRLRTYLKTQSNTMPQLIVNIGKMVSAATHPLAAEYGQATFQLQANAIVLTLLRSVEEVRVELAAMYLGEDFAAAESWTATTEIVQALKSIFFATLPLIPPTAPLTNGVSTMDYEEEQQTSSQRELSSTLSSQAAELAEFLLRAAHQQLAFIQSHGRKAQDVQEAQSAVNSLQSSVITAVNQSGQPNIAIRFAEEYEAFDKLIEVLNPVESASAMAQADHFAEKYGEPFIMLLFDWFINSGHEAELLQLGDPYNTQLCQYLEQSGNLKLSWMHDVRLQKYGNAYQKLEQIAEKEPVLVRKKTLLSTAKLTFLASSEQQQMLDNLAVYKSAAILSIDRALTIIGVQEQILKEFTDVLSKSAVQYTTTEQKAAAIADMLCTKLAENEWNTLKLIFTYLTRLLLDGKMLTEEGLVDILTLRDNRPSQSNNYVTALKLYANAKSVLPAERSAAMLNTIWRRIYINDRWDDLHASRQTCTDTQLAVQLRQMTAFRVIHRCRDLNIQDVLKPRQVQLGQVKWDIKIRFPEIINDSNIESAAGDLRSEQFGLAMFIERCQLQDMIDEIWPRSDD